jgi:hypothetical protein
MKKTKKKTNQIEINKKVNSNTIEFTKKDGTKIIEEVSILEKYKIDRNEEITIANALALIGSMLIALLIYILTQFNNQYFILQFILAIFISICLFKSHDYYYKKPLTNKYNLK